MRFNARQHFSDDPITVCPECGGPTYRVISPVGVIFKGSGFYVTDSRAKQSNLTGGSKKKDSGSTDSSDSGSARSSSADESKSTSTGTDD